MLKYSVTYPDLASISVTETKASIKLQGLLDHTVQRLLQSNSIKNNIFYDKLTLFTKWGCDGSSGHQQYKQKFSEEGTLNDTDIFFISLVPLILYESGQHTINNRDSVVWQNPHPSSTKYCRPICIQYKKETLFFTKQEVEAINNQIKELEPTFFVLTDRVIEIKHELALTMIDGKICNAISENASSQVCYICKALPKEMNNIVQMKERSVNHKTFSFGLSTLHAWIRMFECLIHISYRLEFKKWQARGEENKQMLKVRKQEIQKQFKLQMGLIIDQPKQGGAGNSNDGNTARRFFANPEMSSSITGIKKELIERFATILQVISSGIEINYELFDIYATETAQFFISNYNWFNMPVSVHKILVHGSDIIKFAMVPIGQLSEEAQEARHKEIKKYRECNTRKNSRLNTMQDLLNNLLLSSDPVISSLRKPTNTKKKLLSNEAKSLLILTEHNSEDSDSNSEEDSDSPNEVEENNDRDSPN